MITDFKYVRSNPMTIQEYASILACQTCLDSLDFYHFVGKMLDEQSLKSFQKLIRIVFERLNGRVRGIW